MTLCQSRSRSSVRLRIGGALLNHSVGELSHRANELLYFLGPPLLEEVSKELLASIVDPTGRPDSLRGEPGLPDSVVVIAPTACNKPQTLESRDLTTHGGVVSTYLVGQVDHADRTELLDTDKEREQPSVELHPRVSKQGVVFPGPIDHVHDLEEGPVKVVELFSRPHVRPSQAPDHRHTYIHVYSAHIFENEVAVA